MLTRKTFRLLAASAALAGVLAGLGTLPSVSQGILGFFQLGLPTAPSVVSVGGNVSGLYWGTGLRVGITGHVESGVPAAGLVPVISACGGPTAGDAGSTDTAGSVTNGGGVTTCTITFGTSFVAAPSCAVTDLTGTRAGMAAAVTTASITVTGITASDKLSWLCVAKSGG